MSGDDDRWLARFCAIISRYLRSAGGLSPDAGAAEFTGPIDHAFLRSGAGAAHIEGMLWPAWQAVISAADTPDDTVCGFLDGQGPFPAGSARLDSVFEAHDVPYYWHRLRTQKITL